MNELMIFFCVLLTSDTTISDTTGLDSLKYSYPTKNPALALSLSLLPGGGQFYTKNYLKGAVFAGAQLYFGGGTIYLHWQTAKAKRDKNDWDYDWYSNQRNNFLWWDALVWALSMADAYVSAHFYKFKEQGKLKLDTGYLMINNKYCLGVWLTKSL